MATPGAVWTSAGAEVMQWSKTNSGLHLTGKDGLTSASTGTSSNIARHKGFTGAGFELGDAVTLDIPGDDSVQAKFIFASDTLPEFDLTMSNFDGTFWEAVTGVAAATIGEARGYVISGDALSPASMFMMFTRQAKNPGDVGASSTAGYEHLLLFNPEIYPKSLGAFANKSHNDVTYRVVCNHNTYYPDGRTVVSIWSAAPNSRAIGCVLRTEKRYSFACLVGDGTLAKIVTDHNPSTTTTKHIFTTETTGFAVKSVTAVTSTAPYGISVASGDKPASGKFSIVGYELAGSLT